MRGEKNVDKWQLKYLGDMKLKYSTNPATRQMLKNLKQEHGLDRLMKRMVQESREVHKQTINTITTIAGSHARIQTFRIPIKHGFERKHDTTRKEDRTMANEVNAKRARRKVHDLVHTNMTPFTKFITLTYAENMQDYDKLAHDFKMFRRHLANKGYPFPYLYIVEKQKRGALHLHVLMFHDKYIPHATISKAWPHGYVKINAKFSKIPHHKRPIYVIKYIQKETMPPDKKAYRTSRDIKRPEVGKTYEPDKGKALTEKLPLSRWQCIGYHDYTIEMEGYQDQVMQQTTWKSIHDHDYDLPEGEKKLLNIAKRR